jgi:hypothetical protein
MGLNLELFRFKVHHCALVTPAQASGGGEFCHSERRHALMASSGYALGRITGHGSGQYPYSTHPAFMHAWPPVRLVFESIEAIDAAGQARNADANPRSPRRATCPKGSWRRAGPGQIGD